MTDVRTVDDIITELVGAKADNYNSMQLYRDWEGLPRIEYDGAYHYVTNQLLHTILDKAGFDPEAWPVEIKKMRARIVDLPEESRIIYRLGAEVI